MASALKIYTAVIVSNYNAKHISDSEKFIWYIIISNNRLLISVHLSWRTNCEKIWRVEENHSGLAKWKKIRIENSFGLELKNGVEIASHGIQSVIRRIIHSIPPQFEQFNQSNLITSEIYTSKIFQKKSGAACAWDSSHQSYQSRTCGNKLIWPRKNLAVTQFTA